MRIEKRGKEVNASNMYIKPKENNIGTASTAARMRARHTEQETETANERLVSCTGQLAFGFI